MKDTEKYFLKKYFEIQKKYVKKHGTHETKNMPNEIEDEIIKQQTDLKNRDYTTEETN